MVDLQLEIGCSLFFFLRPGASLDHSDNALQEVIVVKIVRVKGAHALNDGSDLSLSKPISLNCQESLLLRCERLTGSLVFTSLLLFLLLLWGLLLWMNEETDFV